MIHVVTLGMSVVDLLVTLGVEMDLGMLDMGINPHDLSGRREADGVRGDPHFQTSPSVGAKDVLFPHRCRSFSRRRRIEQSPPLRTA
jgi:hypothetical protein